MRRFMACLVLVASLAAVYGSTAAAQSASAYSIAGTIRSQAGQPLGGVTIFSTFLTQATTDSQGTYIFKNVPAGTAYGLYPRKYGYSFNPLKAEGVLQGNAVLDFTAVPFELTLRGRVSVGSRPLAGVTLDGGALGIEITDANGNFVFDNVPYDFRYEIVPSLPGYTFRPAKLRGVMRSEKEQRIKARASSIVTPPAGIPACRDGADNEGDGYVDFPADPGCRSPEDPTEVDSGGPDCDDGKDNDRDGLTDMADHDCSSPEDISESSYDPCKTTYYTQKKNAVVSAFDLLVNTVLSAIRKSSAEAGLANSKYATAIAARVNEATAAFAALSAEEKNALALIPDQVVYCRYGACKTTSHNRALQKLDNILVRTLAQGRKSINSIRPLVFRSKLSTAGLRKASVLINDLTKGVDRSARDLPNKTKNCS